MIRDFADRMRESVAAIPADARPVLMLALAMPVLMLIYIVMPTQDLARAAFSVSLGALAIMVGWLIDERRPSLGYAVGCLAAGGIVASIGGLVMLRMIGADDYFAQTFWRTCAAAQQGWMVIAWGILMVVRHRWLARSAARAAFVVAAVGFAWSLYVNFGVPDPLQGIAQWGEELARGIGARAASPWVDPGLGVVMVAWVLLLWRRWLALHHPDGLG